MDTTHTTDDEQARLWRGTAGEAWVDAQETLDRMFQPLEDRLVGGVPLGSARWVLDVGCGTGSTTLAVARRLGSDGECTGIDISDPMIAMARRRAEREGALARFIRADAQTHVFAPSRFDTIISRLGVMFFDDSVQAFANLLRAAMANAELRFVAWQGAAENPFMTTAERAAAPLLPNLPARLPDAPGQFAFADPHRIRHILEHSGWVDIDIEPIDSACAFPEPQLTRYLTRLGPLGRVLPEVDAQTCARVVETVRAAFEPYVHGAEVRFNAACWMVRARAPAT